MPGNPWIVGALWERAPSLMLVSHEALMEQDRKPADIPLPKNWPVWPKKLRPANCAGPPVSLMTEHGGVQPCDPDHHGAGRGHEARRSADPHRRPRQRRDSHAPSATRPGPPPRASQTPDRRPPGAALAHHAIRLAADGLGPAERADAARDIWNGAASRAPLPQSACRKGPASRAAIEPARG